MLKVKNVKTSKKASTMQSFLNIAIGCRPLTLSTPLS